MVCLKKTEKQIKIDSTYMHTYTHIIYTYIPTYIHTHIRNIYGHSYVKNYRNERSTEGMIFRKSADFEQALYPLP